MKCILINIFIGYSFCSICSEAIIIDNCKLNNNNTLLASSFYDNTGKNIQINRFVVNSGYKFNNSLDFDGSKANELDFYSMIMYKVKPDFFNIIEDDHKLNINFSSMSRPFKGDIYLRDNRNNKKSIPYNFAPNDLNPRIDFLNEGNVISWGSESKDIKNLYFHKFDFTCITEMAFTIMEDVSTLGDLTFSLTSIETIPEPFTLITLSSGVLSFIYKRSKKIKPVYSYKKIV